mgnify:CR=1 FL=1
MKNNLVIAIAREFGSGGREIGQLVAKKLDIPFYDKGIITQPQRKAALTSAFLKMWRISLTTV